MNELAPPPHPVIRRAQRLEAIRMRERQIALLQAEQRLELAALSREDTAGRFARYVSDELALAWTRSPRQARNRLDEALMFADFPAVHARIQDGTWLMDHADAVLDELAASGLDHDAQQQVIDLVLTRRGRLTPWELRKATRTAIAVLFPDHVQEQAERARAERDVETYDSGHGASTLMAHGPTSSVAAMMASLDTMTGPTGPDDDRSCAQRRFDALYDLVCGRAESTQWQAQLVVALSTLNGEDDLPAEIPGHGPIPAQQAREIAARAEVRRVVVDEEGRLVSVDGHVHRPAPRNGVPGWEPAAWEATVRRVRTDPVRPASLRSDRYSVPPPLKRFLVLRDGTCVFPGCPRLAQQCDKDHLIPWPRGSTDEPNLADECEHHHRGKHEYFTVSRLPDGTIRWTTPTGEHYDRAPRPVLESWWFRTP